MVEYDAMLELREFNKMLNSYRDYLKKNNLLPRNYHQRNPKIPSNWANLSLSEKRRYIQKKYEEEGI